MPKVGNKEFDYTAQGIAEAETFSEASGIPVSNAQERTVQTYQLGGMVQPKAARVLNPLGQSLGGYKKGGKVNKKGY